MLLCVYYLRLLEEQMSYKQKQILVSIVSASIVLIAYCFFAVDKYLTSKTQAVDLRFWAVSMLIFIGIGIVVSIIIQILFHIFLSVGTAVRKTVIEGKADSKEIERSIKSEMVEDEMDKLIGLKSSRASLVVYGFGFVAGLFTLAFSIHPAVMLNILFVTFSLASIVEGIIRLGYYKKGIQNA